MWSSKETSGAEDPAGASQDVEIAGGLLSKCCSGQGDAGEEEGLGSTSPALLLICCMHLARSFPLGVP